MIGSVQLIFFILSVNCSHICMIYVKIYEKILSGGLEVSLSICFSNNIIQDLGK